MVAIKVSAILLASAAIVSASPCPFGKLYESGQLSEADSAKFLAARSEKEAAVEKMMVEKREVKIARGNEWTKRALLDGLLPLGGGLLNGVLQPFSGTLQGLDVPTPQPTGLALVPDDDHPFQWPTTSDVRGMCPTLNTMANHGYISRDGITTFAEAANACQITLGFGYDTCVFLSALGLIAGGDLPTGKYSIGGTDSRVPNTLGPALGISHHGPFEIDQSISRSDTYFGNNADFNLTRWNRLVDIANQNDGQFGLSTFAQEFEVTYNEARNTNPEFDAGPKHFAVSLAERVFIYRALPNGTDETNANFANVAPFYLNETFPPFWFRRSTPYSLVNVGTDIVSLIAAAPTSLEIGSNEGLNNFVPGQCFPTE